MLSYHLLNIPLGMFMMKGCLAIFLLAVDFPTSIFPKWEQIKTNGGKEER